MDNYLMIILLFLILITLYFYQENIYEYLDVKRFNHPKKNNKRKKKRSKQIYDSESELSLDKSIDLNQYISDDNSEQFDFNNNDNISMGEESRNRLLEELSIKDSFHDDESNLSLNSDLNNDMNNDMNDYNILD